MTLIELAYHLRPYIEKAVQSLTDTDALEAVQLYPAWIAGESYEPEKRVRHGGKLWRVLQAHTSQAAWTPDAAPSLFAEVLIPDPDTVPEWVQPDSTNPYSKGDKVTHGGKTWESLIDGNVWEPGAVGTESLWQEVSA